MSTAQTFKPVVSILGLGAIGTRVAEILADAGANVTVWNRSPARTVAWRERATVAVTAAEAILASPLVLVCVTNFDGVLEILHDIEGRSQSHTILTLTTGGPEDARAAAALCQRAQVQYLDAAMQAQLEGIGTRAATFLYSGPRAAFDQHRSTLELLGVARHVGVSPEGAAVHDMTLFGLWYDAQIALLRAFETIGRAGIDIESFAPLAATQLRYVLDAVDATKNELVANAFPRGPASLAEHAPVLERLGPLRRELRLGDGDLARFVGLLRARIAEGHEQDGFNSLLADAKQSR
jgi:3-hydroxyisobutyrate dehydrogenase-like beta-hydroxyacid dehydrogenase